MTLHHKKHHQTYVNGLNSAEASFASSPSPKERIALLAALKFNGGGELPILNLLTDRRGQSALPALSRWWRLIYSAESPRRIYDAHYLGNDSRNRLLSFHRILYSIAPIASPCHHSSFLLHKSVTPSVL